MTFIQQHDSQQAGQPRQHTSTAWQAASWPTTSHHHHGSQQAGPPHSKIGMTARWRRLMVASKLAHHTKKIINEQLKTESSKVSRLTSANCTPNQNRDLLANAYPHDLFSFEC